ncbi:hypothetical protein [Actinoplanes sp. OR16]|uniref:hypothetical protein n=1 Tax=Actinoplanes sp. OR16 TaxID=946334 RepID=UPI000FDBFACA|nr:hypothetical protein [Actinoplanes sp. OR16]
MSVDSEAVIEFGAPEKPEREGRAARLAHLRGLGSDHRIPVLVAGVGAVAAFASLISEWQTTTVPDITIIGEDGEGQIAESQMFPASLIDLGGAGAAYMVGLFLVVTTVVLTLFGPAAGRRYARLAGLSVGGVQLALLLAVVQMLGDSSLLISRYFGAQIGQEAPEIAYGRGVWCALAGVAAALVALWLAERAPSGERRIKPRRVEEPESTPDAPLELSITPAEPFAQFPGDRDQPHRA